MAQLTRFNVEKENRFHKNRLFSDFSSFSGILVRFSIKMDHFSFDFHKISLSGIAETR